MQRDWTPSPEHTENMVVNRTHYLQYTPPRNVSPTYPVELNMIQGKHFAINFFSFFVYFA